MRGTDGFFTGSIFRPPILTEERAVERLEGGKRTGIAVTSFRARIARKKKLLFGGGGGCGNDENFWVLRRNL